MDEYQKWCLKVARLHGRSFTIREALGTWISLEMVWDRAVREGYLIEIDGGLELTSKAFDELDIPFICIGDICSYQGMGQYTIKEISEDNLTVKAIAWRGVELYPGDWDIRRFTCLHSTPQGKYSEVIKVIHKIAKKRKELGYVY